MAVALDVLAACLAAGAAMSAAVRAAAAAAPAQAALWRAVGTQLEAGAPPAVAWEPLRSGPLAAAAAAASRTGTTGAAIASELRRVASRERLRRRTAARRRVQRASVLAVVPLGLCFLPAFVLVGIVPIVVSSLPQLVR